VIDLFAFWGFIPCEFVMLVEECGGSCAISNGIMATHFIYKVATGVKRNDAKTRSVALVSKVTVGLVWLNFVGCVLLVLADSDNYQIYESIKMFGGALIVAVFAIASVFFALMIRKTMMDTIPLTPQSGKAELLQLIRRLRTKQIRLLIVWCIACALFVLNGFLVAASDSRVYIVSLAHSPDSVQIGFKIVGLLHVALVCYFFKVPKVDVSLEITRNPSMASARMTRESHVMRGPALSGLVKSSNQKWSSNDDPNTLASASDQSTMMSILDGEPEIRCIEPQITACNSSCE